MKTKILYEDAEVLVIHKPAGLATQSGKIGQADVVSELKNYLVKKNMKPGNNPYLGVVHRLDQPVEGVLVFAKTPKAASNLTAQLQKGTLNKKYYALCLGKKVSENASRATDKTAVEGDLVDYLYKDGMVGKVVSKDHKEAKEARLHYKRMDRTPFTRERLEGLGISEEQIALFDIAIETGRFHQIRLQMSHAGFPLLGDSKYGTEESIKVSKELEIRNVCLFAYQVAFKHPVTGKNMEYTIQPKLP